MNTVTTQSDSQLTCEINNVTPRVKTERIPPWLTQVLAQAKSSLLATWTLKTWRKGFRKYTVIIYSIKHTHTRNLRHRIPGMLWAWIIHFCRGFALFAFFFLPFKKKFHSKQSIGRIGIKWSVWKTYEQELEWMLDECNCNYRYLYAHTTGSLYLCLYV